MSLRRGAHLSRERRVDYRRAKPTVDVTLARTLDRFGSHAVPCHGPPRHKIWRRNFNDGMDQVRCSVAGQSVRWRAIGRPIAAIVNRRASLYRKWRSNRLWHMLGKEGS